MSHMKKVDFSQGNITQNILQTAFPMLVAQMISLLYNIVDRIYIGRIPGTGTQALGAVGLCFPVVILVTAFTNMFGMGGSPLFAMETGRKNHTKAAAILNTSFRMLVITGIIITIVGEIGATPLLRLFGAGEEELIFARPYLHIYLVGTIFSMLATGMNPFINAQGYATVGMLTVLIGALANLILDPIFIFYLNMGVAGAAVATVLSQLLSAIFALRFFYGSRNEYRLVRDKELPDGDGGAGSLPHLGNIVGLGTAPFIMQVTNSLVSIICNRVLLDTGGAIYVSVMTIVSSVRQILDTPIQAIAEGSSPIISYNYGAEKPDNVKKAIRIMTAICVIYTAVMWAVIELKPQILIGIFTSDTQLLTMTPEALHLYFLAFIFQAFQYSGQTTFKALGKKKNAIFFSLFRKVIIVVPLTLILPYAAGMGVRGVFIAEPVSNFIGGTACFVTMLILVRRELREMSLR